MISIPGKPACSALEIQKRPPMSETIFSSRTKILNDVFKS